MGKHARNKNGASGKTGRKPVTLSNCPWDVGPDTERQRAGKRIEDADWTDPDTGEKRNPNGVKRARRIDVAEYMYRQGQITEDGFKAARMLREAWERTMKSAPAIKPVQVDSSPKADQAIAMQIDNASKLHRLTRFIGQDAWGIVSHVVMENRTVGTYSLYQSRDRATHMRMYRRGLKDLSAALDRLAVEIGL